MAQATATAKLVIIDSQSGPQAQIWYPDGSGYVGCGHLKPAEQFDLPDCIISRMRTWKIADTIEYVRSLSE